MLVLCMRLLMWTNIEQFYNVQISQLLNKYLDLYLNLCRSGVLCSAHGLAGEKNPKLIM